MRYNLLFRYNIGQFRDIQVPLFSVEDIDRKIIAILLFATVFEASRNHPYITSFQNEIGTVAFVVNLVGCTTSLQN